MLHKGELQNIRNGKTKFKEWGRVFYWIRNKEGESECVFETAPDVATHSAWSKLWVLESAVQNIQNGEGSGVDIGWRIV